MVGWHHRLNGHELEQTLGDGEGQGSLECCSSWGGKESDKSDRLNNIKFLVKMKNRSFFRRKTEQTFWPTQYLAISKIKLSCPMPLQ